MTTESSPESAAQPPLIVGVGGSAGSLEAFQRFIEYLPADSRLSIVFVIHLPPTHKSMLSELLSKQTAMTVVQVNDGMRLESGHVYVIPPDAFMELHAGHFQLSPRTGDGRFLPIDRFFISLARDVGERAIGVVLSGMGSDGAIGLRQIKEAGGITFCQSPETAERDEMPRAAMATGDADFVFSPADIARTLVDFSRHPYTSQVDEEDVADQLRPTDEQFQQIFALLRTASGVDFTNYKRPTIERRLLRRIALHKLDGVADYLELLARQPQEVIQLYRDILIHVTFFFREPESFAALAEKVFPQIVAERRADEELRIWVPGCSSGEEPYSVAISLLEFLSDEADETPVQIFATDISETAVGSARAGLYPETVVRPVSPHRLRRYFTQVDGKYRVHRKVRDLCVFARHDLTRDPPFSRLDLIVCRNVLIYLGPLLQKRLYSAFYWALKPTGFLMLGNAETVGMQSELFEVVDKKQRLYRKRGGNRAAIDLSFADARHAPRVVAPHAVAPVGEHASHKSVQQEVTQLMLSKYAPPGVLVNEDLEIVQFRGQTGNFLEPSPGEVNLHVLKMVRPGLLYELQEALAEARQTQSAVRKEGLHVAFNSHGRDVSLEVIPIIVRDEPLHFLILFDDVTVEPPSEATSRSRRKQRPAGDGASHQEELEHARRELDSTRKYLQSAIQDLEIANEELQSANEEVLSSNEELQSTNEELDTAKEELQSTNEELNTLNAELHSRNEDLSRVNSDLINLLSSVQIPVVIVDRGLCIRRFTPTAEGLFNLIATDVGRPLPHIKPNIDCPQLESWIHDVIEKVAPLEREIQDVHGIWFLLRVRPYCSIDNRIEGAVIALFDIDAIKKRELQVAELHEYALAIVRTVREGLIVLDENMIVQTINQAFCRMFAVSAEETTGKHLYELGNGQWNVPPLRSLLEDILPSNSQFEGFEVEYDFPRVGRKKLILNARRLQRAAGHPALVLLAIEEVRSPA